MQLVIGYAVKDLNPFTVGGCVKIPTVSVILNEVKNL